MDEGDDYVPQMSQMTDYTMMGGPPPQAQPSQQRYPQPMNPYQQQQQSHQQMMMMQQQHMQHMAGQQQQQGPPPQVAQPAPAKKPRGKSKKAQAEAAAAAAAAAQMDPMASMAAMSNNPMMRQNAYPNQMGMYGGGPPPHYQGANGPTQQGYRPGPAAAGPQGQYPPQSYQQMYHQRPPQAQPSQQPGGYPPYGYPPQPSSGYPTTSQQPQYPQQAPPHMRHQYPPQSQQQQAPPGYWDGYQGYNSQQPQPGAAPPVSSQQMQMSSQDQWGRPNELMSIIAQLEKSSAECKSRIHQLYNMPRNAAADAEVEQLQHKLASLQNDHYRYSQQLQHAQYQMAAAGGHHPNMPPQGPIPTSQTSQMPTSQHHGAMTPNAPPPVHVNQSGSQVQLNITADKSRTLISVYHEGYGATGSGASSTESKESIVPPEPTPSIQQQPAHEPQVPQIKTEQEKPSQFQQQQSQPYNGMENGASSNNPYSQQQQQNLMYGQYPQHHQQNSNMPGYPSQSHQLQQPASVPIQHQQQHPPGYGISVNTAPSSTQMKQEPPAVEAQSQSQSQTPQQSVYPGYPDYTASASTSNYQETNASAPESQNQPSPSVADPIMTPPIQRMEEEKVTQQEDVKPEEPSSSLQEMFDEPTYLTQSSSNDDIAYPSVLSPKETQSVEESASSSIPPESEVLAEKVETDHDGDNGVCDNFTPADEKLDFTPSPVAPKYEDEEKTEVFEDQIEEIEIPASSSKLENGGKEEEVEEEEQEEEQEALKEESVDREPSEENTLASSDIKENASQDNEDDEMDEEGSSAKDSKEDLKEEDDDDMSTITKDMSEAPSETNDGFTEPSTPATPMMSATSSSRKKSYRRPAVVVAKSRKKKSADDSDDDDFYPQRGRSKKKGGGGKKKNELEEEGEGAKSDDDDDEFLMKIDAPAPDPNALIVEKILNVRMHKVESVVPEKEEANGEDAKEEKPAERETKETEEVEQFLIKWKGRAYVHCEWKTAAELLEIDKRVDAKIKRFKTKKSVSYIEDDEDFNSDFVIVERVVDLITEDDGQEFVLIKWKSLGYEEVTWEPIENVPSEKIELWRQRQVIDPAKIKEKNRPDPDEWKKMSTSKVWKNGNSLREYQFEGVDWLLYCYYNAQNCILADEMGLGKTVQTITFLSQVYDYGIHGPFLVVVPLSTIQNWVREFETWTDMNAIVYHGSAYAREVLQQYEVFYDKRHSGAKNWKKNFVKIDALITTFETVVSDVEFLKKIPWRVCVIDEAHRLKNRNCKLLVNGLLAFRMEHRVLLTGTPLQNNIEELFSLLNFLHPQQFDNSATFLEQFGSCQTDDQVQKLQEILKPMMLRRLKEDVEKSLGPKEETIIEVQLSDMQKKFYRAILERNFSHLCKGTSAPSLMNVMMELRKCCNHPFLINGAEETIMNDFKLAHPDWDDETLAHKALVQASGKVVLIEKLLPKLRKDGHKVLIFSQMVKVLDLLEEFLISMAYPFERIDGNVRGDLRQAAIDRFSRENSDRFVFLLCTRAGGLGINLTAADTVIIFDSDWNPQNDLQAQARCHRIGQKKLVKVYRLITSNTYEREMFDKASLKLGLDKAVLQSTTALKAEGTALSKKDVEELLKKGAYGSIMDEENDSAKFNEEDIETILQRRTQTITLEAGQKGSLFAKATFNSTHNKGDDIDIDDPEFWTKWAEKAQVDVEKATATPDGRELIIEEPRKRTKRFEENKIDEVDSDGSEESGKRKRNGPGGSNRKRRKGDDEDGDYSGSYRPDELATSKAEYFKVEKVLAQYGWGRWPEIKKYGELEISEQDIEHMSRTLLLHCIREFRGDDRIRQFVFNLIKPEGTNENSKYGAGSMYNQGWAALPEFNPPSFALDSAFQRHVHRHANKLMIKIDMLKHLETHIIADERELVEDPTVKWSDITLKEMPTVSETFVEGWDADCDKSFLIGCWRHGLDNYDVMREDENLCFHEKTFPIWPPPSDFWLRFRRLLMVSQRSVHDPVYEKLKWSKREEQEYLRVLRSYGIKELKPGPGLDWSVFKTLSQALEKKPDEELHEQLMCLIAMCNRATGMNDLKPIDLKRAMSVDPMGARKATKTINRLHLMRKVHTLAEHLEAADLSLCETTGMPSGWNMQHDKELIEICDQCGLEKLAANVLNKPAFTKIVRPSETTLLRRVIEVVATIEAGKWCGVGDVESVNDSDSEDKKDMAAIATAQAQFLRLQQQQAQQQAAAAASAKKGNRKRPNNDQDAKMKAMQQMLMGQGGNDYASMIALMLMPQMMAAGGAQNMTAAQQQQLNQMLTLLLASAVQQSATTTSTSSSKNNSNNQIQSAATALAQAAAASNDAQHQQAVLEAILTMAMNPAAMAALSSQPSTSSGSTATKKVSKPAAPKESASSSSTATAAAAAAAAASASASASTQAATVYAAMAAHQQNTKTQEELIVELLTTAGVGMAELNKMNTLPKDSRIPMIHKTTKEKLPEAERPQIRDLTVFVLNRPDYSLDSATFNEIASSSGKQVAAGSTRPTPAATPKPSTPKVESAKVAKTPSTPTPSASATCNIKVGGSLQFDDIVSVYNRKTGELLAAAKWPKANELAAWLDANPDCNVHKNSALIAHLSVGNTHADRIGGDAVVTSAPSTAHTPAPALTPTTPASMSAANAQLMALAAAQQASQQTPTTSSTSKSRSILATAAAAQAAAAASSQQDAYTKQQLEMLQMQLIMQQYQQAAITQMLYGGYGMQPTSSASSSANMTSMAALAAAQAASVSNVPTTSKQTASTPSTSASTAQAATSAATSASSAEEINPLLLSALMQNPALLQTMMLSDPSVMAALTGQPQQPAAKKSKHP